MFGCTKAYSRQDSLKNHVRKDHQLENATKLGRFVCSMCGAAYYHAKNLAQHCETEHQNKISKS